MAWYSARVFMDDDAGFEIFAVTADKGIRAWGRDLREVFVNAARGMWSLMVEPGTARCRQRLTVTVEAADRETLLVAWLNELLYLYEVEEFVAAEFSMRHLTDTALAAEVCGERVDRERHPLVGHVKAATYHLLEVCPTESGWKAQVVVDV
ncbi:MAG: archease [candidate division NC10 bacterium]|nr:archease [candidate division NC10 bacterium]